MKVVVVGDGGRELNVVLSLGLGCIGNEDERIKRIE